MVKTPGTITFEIKSFKTLVKLTMTYTAGKKLLELTHPGWPAVLSNLKSFLETDKPLQLDEVFGPEKNPAKR